MQQSSFISYKILQKGGLKCHISTQNLDQPKNLNAFERYVLETVVGVYRLIIFVKFIHKVRATKKTLQ